MILATGRAAPLRFLLAVVLAWSVARGIMLVGWRPAPMLARAPAPMPPAAGVVAAAAPTMRAAAAPSARSIPTVTQRRPHARDVARPDSGEPSSAPVPGIAAASASARGAVAATASPLPPLLVAPHAEAAAAGSKPSWLSGSAWAFVRGGGFARPLAPGGQIGGGQAGARILARVTGGLAVAARVSRTIGGARQSEAALGIDWAPLAGVPLHLTAERRVALDRGGRNAVAIGVAGGAYAVRLAPGWRLDGYAEAGVVGARRRDPYGDGAIRIGRALPLGHEVGVTVGVGAWGGAQPGAARLDAGPSAVLRAPVAGRTIGVAFDYRARLAGDARPHSGVALTVGIDF